MTESNLTKKILLKLSVVAGLRLFRNNVGMAWIGKVTNRSHGHITLSDPRPLHAGLFKGSSDLIGWQSQEITPDMVGKKVAVFTSIEIKKPSGRVTKEQKNWLNQVQQAGGIARIMRTEEDAMKCFTK